jgi:hypothetical protein
MRSSRVVTSAMVDLDGAMMVVGLRGEVSKERCLVYEADKVSAPAMCGVRRGIGREVRHVLKCNVGFGID